MKKIVETIENIGYDLSNFKVLEMFGRQGDMTVKHYINEVKSVTAFELNPTHATILQKVLGDKGHVLQEDSIKWLRTFTFMQPVTFYDLIVIDNPQGIYCSAKYCEHFDFASVLPSVMAPTCFVSWVVNNHPFDCRTAKFTEEGKDDYGMTNEEVDLWFKRRQQFYGSSGVDVPISKFFLAKFYERFFDYNGMRGSAMLFSPIQSTVVDKPDYLYRLLCKYTRT